MQREIPRGGMLGFEDDRVQVSDVVCRAVPQRALLNLRRERGRVSDGLCKGLLLTGGENDERDRRSRP